MNIVGILLPMTENCSFLIAFTEVVHSPSCPDLHPEQRHITGDSAIIFGQQWLSLTDQACTTTDSRVTGGTAAAGIEEGTAATTRGGHQAGRGATQV